MSILKTAFDKIKGIFVRPAQPEKTEHSEPTISIKIPDNKPHTKEEIDVFVTGILKVYDDRQKRHDEIDRLDAIAQAAKHEDQMREERRQRELRSVSEAIEILGVLEKDARIKECPFNHKLQYSKTKSQKINWGKWKGRK